MTYASISLNFMQPVATRSFWTHRLCRTTQLCSSPYLGWCCSSSLYFSVKCDFHIVFIEGLCACEMRHHIRTDTYDLWITLWMWSIKFEMLHKMAKYQWQHLQGYLILGVGDARACLEFSGMNQWILRNQKIDLTHLLLVQSCTYFFLENC